MYAIRSYYAEYDTPLGVNRTWVPYKVVGKYPTVKKQFLPRLCNHCDDPPCVRNCPVDATYKVEDGGFVLQRYERCIGCRTCMASCPYNARFMLPAHRTYTDITKVVDKCTFCFHRVTQGLAPRITSYNVCYTKLLRARAPLPTGISSTRRST